MSSFFGKTLLAPADYIFAKEGDDFKNYYTLKTYIDQSVNDDVIHYNSMNYPFKDVVYYCDNTPILAAPLKFISLHTGWRINPIVPFNYLVIFAFIFATLLCYLLLSKVIQSKVLVIILSISLPYFNPQAYRIVEGTENLSLSFILLANLVLLYKIYENTENSKNLRLWNLLNLALIILSSFVHLYYLIILCLNTGLFLFIYTVYRLATNKTWIKTLASSATVPLAALTFVLTFFMLTDEFYQDRGKTAMGYNIMPWKTNFSGFYKPYDYLHIKFIIEPNYWISYEANTYLGGFVLYGLLSIIILAFIKKLGIIERQKEDQPLSKSWFIILLTVASLFSLCIAFGPNYELFDGRYIIRNYFNLFSIARLFSDKVTHFRCLGRFSWLFFWAINFSVAYWLDRWVSRGQTLAVIMLYILSFIAVKDMADSGAAFRTNQFKNAFEAQNMPAEILQINNSLKAGKYDAILPLPFFLVGSEIHNRTIDAVNYNFYAQLSSLSGLPLMSSQLARTPLTNNESLFNLFLQNKADSSLSNKLKGKTIAVIKNSDDYNRVLNRGIIDQDELRMAFTNSADFPDKFKMTGVDTVGKYYVYKWQL